MAEKRDLRSLSKTELIEMLQRQEKLLTNKRFLQTLPDKGAKINQLVEKLRTLVAAKKEIEDLSSRFNAIQVSGPIRGHQHGLTLDSDDDDYEGSTHDDRSADPQSNTTPLNPSEKFKTSSSLSSKPVNPSEKPSSSVNNKPGTWDYDSAVTRSRFYKCEKAKAISAEESMQLQQEQTKRHEALLAEQAAKRLQEHMSRRAEIPQNKEKQPTTYKFSSSESKYKYRDTNETMSYQEDWDHESDKESDKESDTDSQESDEDNAQHL